MLKRTLIPQLRRCTREAKETIQGLPQPYPHDGFLQRWYGLSSTHFLPCRATTPCQKGHRGAVVYPDRAFGLIVNRQFERTRARPIMAFCLRIGFQSCRIQYISPTPKLANTGSYPRSATAS